MGAILLLALIPPDLAIEDRVDMLEVNHFYSQDGELIFRQLIGWDWDANDSCFHVVFWRLVKSTTPGVRPRKTKNGYESLWRDGENLRRVSAAARKETWTQRDRELDDRAVFSKSYRRGLTRRKTLGK